MKVDWRADRSNDGMPRRLGFGSVLWGLQPPVNGLNYITCIRSTRSVCIAHDFNTHSADGVLREVIATEAAFDPRRSIPQCKSNHMGLCILSRHTQASAPL
jgi:hypothetical protein